MWWDAEKLHMIFQRVVHGVGFIKCAKELSYKPTHALILTSVPFSPPTHVSICMYEKHLLVLSVKMCLIYTT